MGDAFILYGNRTLYCRFRSIRRITMEINEVYNMLFPNYRRSVIKSLIVVLFEFPLFLGLILALVIYWTGKDFELVMVSIIYCLLMFMIFCIRLSLLIGGIKKMYLLKRGEVIDADLLYFKWIAGVAIIKVKYTYFIQI